MLRVPFFFINFFSGWGIALFRRGALESGNTPSDEDHDVILPHIPIIHPPGLSYPIILARVTPMIPQCQK